MSTTRTAAPRPGCIIAAAIWLLFAVPLGALVGAIIFYQLDHADRIYAGVRIGDVPVGGLTLEQAAEVVQATAVRPAAAPVTIRYGERSWTITPNEVGVTSDTRSALSAAYAVGRRGALAAQANSLDIPTALRALRDDLLEQLQVYRAGYVITPTLTLNESRLTLALRRIAREVDVPPREAQLTVVGLEVRATPGTAGRLVDIETMQARVAGLMLSGRGGTVELLVTEREPAVKSVEAAAARVATILSRPLILALPGAETLLRVTVERETLRDWLRFVPAAPQDGSLELGVQVNSSAVTQYLKELAGRFDRPAQDAVLEWDKTRGQVQVVKPSQAGQALDIVAATTAISNTIVGLADIASSRDVTLPVKLLKPKVDSTRLADLGIVELVSEGTTYFAGSSRERVQNIVAAANKFRNVVIPPGEEFSFNRYVGEINAANGFVDSYIIWGDRTAVGIGGGVCQVSTTAFRAAFFGGFPITERWAHGYVVSWYGDPGLDATIYTPHVDFRFRNDTGHYLLIQAEVNTAQSRITFYFYGTRPARTVEMDKPIISNVKTPEGPIYQEDLTLAAGVIRQVEWARNGMDVVVKRRIVLPDGQKREEEFVSRYQPWRSVFLFGPGTQLPPGVQVVPAATPTPAPTPGR